MKSVIVFFSLALVAAPVMAQQAESTDFTGQAPTADQLIHALKTPKRSGMRMRGATRGIGVTQKKVNLTVQFELNSARLTSDARQVLDHLGTAMLSNELNQDRFKIVGHTDASGDAQYNQRLSEERAQAVTYYLSRNFGIEQDRLSSRGMGEMALADPANPRSARNRRVEVINTGQ